MARNLDSVCCLSFLVNLAQFTLENPFIMLYPSPQFTAFLSTTTVWDPEFALSAPKMKKWANKVCCCCCCSLQIAQSFFL